MHDPQRPRYHFLPPAGWMNDPNGLIQWRGRYHMFYQFNPVEARHNQIAWGHASSANLVNWQPEPLALQPDPGGPDADGCWSGCAVDADGIPTLIYSGHRHGQLEAPCRATSTDGLQTWQKDPTNPLFAPPAGLDLLAMRDHCVWREGDGWTMLIGAGLRGRGGTALRFRSPDLRNWAYLGPLLVADELPPGLAWTGSVWECPDLFSLGAGHALAISVWEDEPNHSLIMLGSYQAGRFTPTQAQKFDFGDRYWYAPQSFCDDQGRRIVFGWAPEGRSEAAQLAAGWAGVMSLPRELACDSAGRLTIRPVAEVTHLRREQFRLGPLTLAADTLVPLACSGASLEVALSLDPVAGGQVGLALRRSPDGSEATWLWYDPTRQELRLDRSQASRDLTVDRTSHTAPLRLDPGEPLRLRIFLDASLIEIFANERVALTSRIYPTLPTSLGLALASSGPAVTVSTCDVWRLAL